MEGSHKSHPPPSNFRQFFFRGLAILLPSVLTIWILLAAYQFVQNRIAAPINSGVQEVIVHVTPWPAVSETQIEEHRADVRADRDLRQAYDSARNPEAWLHRDARRVQLDRWWRSYAFPMDLIGLIIAIVLIYMAGLLLGSYIGRRLYARGEAMVNQVPLVGRVYPAVKQVTDFFVGQDREKVTFNRVVAVEYPRKGLWSVGLVTGDTMSAIQAVAGADCMTVFIPSSPTPFTGYVITVPKSDTVELPITVEDAMKFAVSGGVLIPPNQMIVRSEAGQVEGEASSSLPSPQQKAGRKSGKAQAASGDGEAQDAVVDKPQGRTP
ncbi:DUF502 domain-containing protein [Phycisphaerales bacterium AB-hyl4]|uniref:DUF502 domain-containing protein n=1 Tax=Natronomicrosphaera hydrolytica TaxID=3242702 RepID=A0ABV4U4J8_9BACT